MSRVGAKSVSSSLWQNLQRNGVMETACLGPNETYILLRLDSRRRRLARPTVLLRKVCRLRSHDHTHSVVSRTTAPETKIHLNLIT